MLARDVRAAVLSAGLHPGFGVLHSTSDRSEACVWDLMEGHRAVLAEGVAVSLFNRGRLKAELFEARPGGVRIAAEGRRALILGYEDMLSRKVKSRHSGKRHAGRRLIIEDARAYARHQRDPAGAAYSVQVQDY